MACIDFCLLYNNVKNFISKRSSISEKHIIFGFLLQEREMILISQIHAIIRLKPKIHGPSRYVFGRFFAKSCRNGADMGGKNPYRIIMLSI